MTVTDTTPTPPTDTQPVAASPTRPPLLLSVSRCTSMRALRCARIRPARISGRRRPDGPTGTQWPLGTGVVLSFTFTGAHTVWARLTVTDADGDTNNVMRQFQVTTATSHAPSSASSASSTHVRSGQSLDRPNGGTCVRQPTAGPTSDAQACSSMAAAYLAAQDGDVVRSGTVPTPHRRSADGRVRQQRHLERRRYLGRGAYQCLWTLPGCRRGRDAHLDLLLLQPPAVLADDTRSFCSTRQRQ